MHNFSEFSNNLEQKSCSFMILDVFMAQKLKMMVKIKMKIEEINFTVYLSSKYFINFPNESLGNLKNYIEKEISPIFLRET